MAIKAGGIALLLYVLTVAGCSSLSDEVVQRTLSVDGQFWAEVSVNRGSALKPDWYAVTIGPVHHKWFEILPRQRGHALCTLQGEGTINVKWTGARDLRVTCSGCSKKDVFVLRSSWEDVHVAYNVE